MLETVKNALRVKTGAFDVEVAMLIAACFADLCRLGISAPKGCISDVKKVDPLILRATILYAKANFGYSEDGERYQRAYDALVTSLCLAGDYIG